MVAVGDVLAVLWETTPVGQLTVTEVDPRPEFHSLRVMGAWTPAAGLVACQLFLEERDRLEKAWEDSEEAEPDEHLVAANDAINERLRLVPELPGTLTHFGVEDGKGWALMRLPGAKPCGPNRHARPRRWQPGDPIPIPSHLAGWVTSETYQDHVLIATVRCPCGSERLEFRYPGVTHLIDGQRFPCSAEIGGAFFTIIQAACPDCQREHVLFDSHFHGCDGFLNPESKQRTLPRPPLSAWRCLRCESNWHTAEVGVVLDYADAYLEYGYAERFGAEHWPDAFGWISIGLTCCGCGVKTPRWVDYETR